MRCAKTSPAQSLREVETIYKNTPNWQCAKCATTTATASTSATPTTTATTKTIDTCGQRLTAIQININGICNKISELQHLVNRENPHLVIIQESKLRTKTRTPDLKGYTSARCDRPSGDGGGGLIIYLMEGLKYEHITSTSAADDNFEHQHIRVPHNGEPLNIINIYAPPGTNDELANGLGNITPGQTATLVCGDFNGHSDLWHSALAQDPRGRTTTEWIEDNELVVLNTATPTRAPIANPAQRSSPDVSCTSTDLALDTLQRPPPNKNCHRLH